MDVGNQHSRSVRVGRPPSVLQDGYVSDPPEWNVGRIGDVVLRGRGHKLIRRLRGSGWPVLVPEPRPKRERALLLEFLFQFKFASKRHNWLLVNSHDGCSWARAPFGFMGLAVSVVPRL